MTLANEKQNALFHAKGDRMERESFLPIFTDTGTLKKNNCICSFLSLRE